MKVVAGWGGKAFRKNPALFFKKPEKPMESKTLRDLVKRLRIKADVIEMGERIQWGSDSAIMREAADVLEANPPCPAPLDEEEAVELAAEYAGKIGANKHEIADWKLGWKFMYRALAPYLTVAKPGVR